MRVNYAKGKEPLGLCKYLCDVEKQRSPNDPPIIAMNMGGRTPEELAEEFRFSHDLNPRVKNTMVHFAVSMPIGETVSTQTIEAVSKELLRLTGHEDCQYFVVRHYDHEADNHVLHWHIATSAVDLKGQWVDDAFIKLRLKNVERTLEKRFHLQAVLAKEPKDQKNLTTGEYRLKARTGAELPKETLWRKIDSAALDHPSMAIIAARLKIEGVEVRFHEFEDRIEGISFELEGSHFKGRSLGKAYSFEGLQKYQGVEHSRSDDSLLIELQQMTPEGCREWLHQDTQRKRSRHIYDQYSYDTERLTAEQRDITIAARCLSEVSQHQATLAILSGDTAQAIEKKSGLERALEYAARIVQCAIDLLKQLARESRKAIEQWTDRDLER